MAYTELIARKGYGGQGFSGLGDVTIVDPNTKKTYGYWKQQAGQIPQQFGGGTSNCYVEGSGYRPDSWCAQFGTKNPYAGGWSGFWSGITSMFGQQAMYPGQYPGMYQQPTNWTPILLVGGLGLAAVLVLSKKKKAE